MAEFELFGLPLREKFFQHHDPDLVRLNNGSFGSCPSIVLDVQNSERNRWLRNPDDAWYSLPQDFQIATKSVIDGLFPIVNAQDLILIDNLTVGIALIIHSVISNISEENTVILASKFTYNAVILAIEHGVKINNLRRPSIATPLSVVYVDIPFPLITDDPKQEIIQAYTKTLEEIQTSGKSIAFAFLDHIVSLPFMLMPVSDLIPLLRAYGTKEILVDGAHTPGQIDLSPLPTLGCDYYTANLHKWCFSPTSVAFLWISPNAPSRSSLHHPIVSHSFGQGLQAESAMIGTRDYSAIFSVPAALSFLNDQLGGQERVFRRNRELQDQVVDLLSSAWDRDTLSVAQHPSLRSPSLCMIGCPSSLGDSWVSGEELRVALRERFKIVIQKPYPVPGDRLYLRLSFAVYNTIQEYLLLRDAVLTLVQEKTISSGKKY